MSNDQSIATQPLSIARRRFLQSAAAGLGMLGMSGLAVATDGIPATQGLRGTKSKQRDQDILNFALNLEYLEAEFYLRAVTGKGLGGTTGFDDIGSDLGQPGDVIGGRKVNFATKNIEDYANEIAADELAHVRFLRKATTKTVPRPAIDLQNSFTAAARILGLVGPNEVFDAFANENNFLLAAFIFEDVGVTAYKGAARFISSGDILEAAAGILAVEAYHSGLIRTVLGSRQDLRANPGSTQPAVTIGQATNAISGLRDTLDGNGDSDQGILFEAGIPDPRATIGGTGTTTLNIVPTDANGLAFSRTPGQVLAIVYGSPTAESGLFLPNGVNGRIR